jgi:nucleotide-binding universal stress UspA family protein
MPPTTTTSSGPVLLGTIGQPDSAAAVRVGTMFASRHHRALDVIGVLPLYSGPIRGYPPYAESADEILRDSTTTLIRDQLRQALSDANASVRIETGMPGETIAWRAQAIGASLVVVGLNPRSQRERLIGLETAISVLRHDRTSVLAVTPDTQVQMTVIAIATDLDTSPLPAAQLAMDLAMPDAELHVIHVAPAGTDKATLESLRPRLGAFADSLQATPPMRVTTHLLTGDATTEILTCCHAHGVELIALASHGKSWFTRLRLGSVTESILRAAPCAVLVAPPIPSSDDTQPE